ncbi:MAG: hypothetical protein RLZZ104_2042 [Pseudomonadota bacterium]|jgi:hypothetical protein
MARDWKTLSRAHTRLQDASNYSLQAMSFAITDMPHQAHSYEKLALEAFEQAAEKLGFALVPLPAADAAVTKSREVA